MQLFHFSDDPGIGLFTPRPVLVPSIRPPGREWLNGPLVWAIDDWHQPMYFFPRDCPRILIWATPQTSIEDHERHWRGSRSRIITFVEKAWLAKLRAATIWRYELPAATFASLQDAGMWVSDAPVRPLRKDLIADMVSALEVSNVELRPVEDFSGLRHLWSTSLHASGIRLRNAAGWNG